MKEQWSKWIPIPNLKAQYYIDDLHDTIDTLKVELDAEEQEQQVLISFKNHSVCAYRVTEETLRDQTLHELGERYGSEFYISWTLFKVESSRYLAWLSEQAETSLDDLDLVHYVIYGTNCLLDVAATDKPEVTISSDQKFGS